MSAVVDITASQLCFCAVAKKSFCTGRCKATFRFFKNNFIYVFVYLDDHKRELFILLYKLTSAKKPAASIDAVVRLKTFLVFPAN